MNDKDDQARVVGDAQSERSLTAADNEVFRWGRFLDGRRKPTTTNATDKYKCPRCAADRQPKFGSPRNCAFNADGSFQTDNWNCASIEALFDAADERVVIAAGDDCTLEAIPVRVDRSDEADDEADDDGIVVNGFIVLTRYKRRGRTTSAVHVGDFLPPQPVTLALVDEAIATYAADKAAWG